MDLNPPRDQPLVVVCGGVERTHPDYVVERSDFPYFGIELVTEGNGHLTLSDEHFRLQRGVVFAYGPGIEHRIENKSSDGMRKYFLDFVGTDGESLLKAAGLLDGKPILASGIIEFTDLWNAIDREAREKSDVSREICQSLARILLLKIQQRRVNDGTHAPTAFRTYETVRQFIEENYMKVSTVEQVAEACGISPVYVSRLFKRYSATGAYQFLLRLRMNHAADLLMKHGLLVREVADSLGFADAFQFSRAFKRVYGVAPSSLVDSRQRGNGGVG